MIESGISHPNCYGDFLKSKEKLNINTGYNQSVTGCGYERRHVVVTQRKLI